MKNKNKIAAIALSGILICGLLSSCGDSKGTTTVKKGYFYSSNVQYTTTVKEEAKPVYTKSFDAIGGQDVMPIGTWGQIRNGVIENAYVVESMLNDEGFQILKDCGVNFAIGGYDYYTKAADVIKVLELSEKFGMGYFVMENYILSNSRNGTIETSQYDELTPKFTKYRSFMGYMIGDEPSVAKMANTKKSIDAFKASTYGDYYTPYCNAYPSYAEPTGLSGTSEGITFAEYIDAYNQMGLDYCSFDFYPFPGKNKIRATYFSDLSDVRNGAEKAKIPFWVFVQTGWPYKNQVQENIVNEGQFLWNVNTNLAYGAKGMQYFTGPQENTYYDRNDPDGATRSGLIGYYNNLNEWYFYAKKANAQIAAIDYVLMNAHHDGVIFHGNSPTPASEGEEVITEGKYRQLTGVYGDDALVGCFDYYGGTALYVVNNSFEKENAKIALTFDDVYGYDIIQHATSVFAAGNALEFTLEAGEGVLVVLR